MQLGWAPDVLGVSEQFILHLGCSAMWQILPADPLQFFKLIFLFPPQVQHIGLAVNS